MRVVEDLPVREQQILTAATDAIKEAMRSEGVDSYSVVMCSILPKDGGLCARISHVAMEDAVANGMGREESIEIAKLVLGQCDPSGNWMERKLS